MHLAAVRRAVLVQEPLQRVHLTEVEQLELRHHLPLLAELVELAHERPRVGEDVVAEVRRAHGQAARVRLGVEHLEPVVERVVHRAPGGELHDEAGVLAQGGHRVLQPAEVERGAVLVVADVHMDHRRPGRLALTSGGDQLVERRGELRAGFLGGLRAGRCDGDQEAVGGDVWHADMVSERSVLTRPGPIDRRRPLGGVLDPRVESGRTQQARRPRAATTWRLCHQGRRARLRSRARTRCRSRAGGTTSRTSGRVAARPVPAVPMRCRRGRPVPPPSRAGRRTGSPTSGCRSRRPSVASWIDGVGPADQRQVIGDDRGDGDRSEIGARRPSFMAAAHRIPTRNWTTRMAGR